MGIRDDARRNRMKQMREQSAEVARRQAAATSRPGMPTLFDLAAASARQKAIDTLPELVANKATAARRQQPQRVMRMLATDVNDAEERELRRLEAGNSSERENNRSRRRTVGHQPMIDPMELLLSNQERQRRINELLGLRRVPLIRRVNRVRTGLARNRDRRIAQKFKNNTGKIFTFMSNRGVVVLRNSDGKDVDVDRRTFKQKYVATGNLAQKRKSDSDAKRQQRLKNQILKKGGKTDVFRVQPRTMTDTDRKGFQFERVLGRELVLTNDAIKKLIKHAKVNPNAVRAGRVAETFNKNALEGMLRKGIRIDADAAPAGGRMLGIGRATGNQAEMFMQPMSLVAEFVGGRRKPNARYFYSPQRRRISESTPSRNNTAHTRKANQKATQKIAQKPKQKAMRKATRKAIAKIRRDVRPAPKSAPRQPQTFNVFGDMTSKERRRATKQKLNALAARQPKRRLHNAAGRRVRGPISTHD
jgi:hypothetical protein